MNPNSEVLALTLRRNHAQEPWGFRLQGGTDFSTPLSIQAVNPGSVAERCGLRAGDAVLNLNGRSSHELEHEEAKRMLLVAGAEAQLTVQRGGVSVWKPQVTPMSQLKPNQFNIPQSGDSEPLVQRTSLAANKQESMNIGSAFNRSARPFPSFGGGGAPAQAPAAPPAQPPNTFQPINAQNEFHSQPSAFTANYGNTNNNIGNDFSAPAQAPAAPSAVSGFKSVRAPVGGPAPGSAPVQQHPVCNACGKMIVGVFVRISGQQMCPGCFTCAACGKNLKNQGHYTVGNQFYCDACTQ